MNKVCERPYSNKGAGDDNTTISRGFAASYGTLVQLTGALIGEPLTAESLLGWLAQHVETLSFAAEGGAFGDDDMAAHLTGIGKVLQVIIEIQEESIAGALSEAIAAAEARGAELERRNFVEDVGAFIGQIVKERREGATTQIDAVFSAALRVRGAVRDGEASQVHAAVEALCSAFDAAAVA